MSSTPQPAPSDFADRLMSFRSRLLKKLAWHSTWWWLVCALVGLLAFGIGDWQLRWDHGLWRWGFWLSLLLATLAIVARFIVGPAHALRDPTQIAMYVESRFPGWQSRLTSMLQFAEAEYAAHSGSEALQRRQAALTDPELLPVDVEAMLPPHRVRRVGGVAVLMAFVVVLTISYFPGSAGTALARMLAPWSELQWAPRVHLSIADDRLNPLDDTTIAHRYRTGVAGDLLELRAVNNRGRVPSDTHFEFRLDGERFSQAATVLKSADRSYGVTAIRLKQGKLRFRVVGGDDRDMEWQSMAVVPPPAITAFDVTLQNPEYLGSGVTRLKPNTGGFTAVPGTIMKLVAKANRPMKQVEVDISGLTGFRLTRHSGNIWQGHIVFPQTEGEFSWEFRLVDEFGHHNRRPVRYSARIEKDEPPVATLRQPRRDITATRGAVVPITIDAADDYSLKTVMLRWRVAGKKPAGAINALTVAAGANQKSPKQSVKEITQRRLILLQPLDLAEGDRVLLQAVASDWLRRKPQNPEQFKATPRTVTIVSAETKLAELGAEQQSIVDLLVRLRKSVERARTQAGSLVTRLQSKSSLSQADRDLIATLDDGFRSQFLPQLIDSQESRETTRERSLESILQAISSELRNNRLPAPALSSRLAALAAELSALREGPLKQMGSRLDSIAKIADSTPVSEPLFDKRSFVSRLQQLRDEQSATDAALARMVAILKGWQLRQGVLDLLRDLITEQNAINAATGALIRDLSGARPNPQQRTRLEAIAARQLRLGDPVSRLQQATKKAAADPETVRSIGKTRLDAFASALASKVTLARVAELSNTLGKSPGVALPLQQKFVEDLEALGRMLGGEQQPAHSRAELLRDLKTRLERLITKAKSAEVTDPSFNREATRLRIRAILTETDSVLRMMTATTLPIAEAAVRRASRDFRVAERLTGNKGEHKVIAARQQSARDGLEQALREVIKAMDAARTDDALSRFNALLEKLNDLGRAQRKLAAEVRSLAAEVKSAGRWKLSLRRKLISLRKRQAAVQKELTGLAKGTPAASLVSYALRISLDDLQPVLKVLQESTPDFPATLVDEMHAVASRLKSVREKAGQAVRSRSESDPDRFLSGIARLRLLRYFQWELTRPVGRLKEKAGVPVLRGRQTTLNRIAGRILGGSEK